MTKQEWDKMRESHYNLEAEKMVAHTLSDDESGISLSDLREMEDIARLLQKVWPDLPSIGELSKEQE